MVSYATNTSYGLLTQLTLRDMATAPELYRPTNFWSSTLGHIIRDMEVYGIETFMQHPSAHSLYIPTYSPIVKEEDQKLCQAITKKAGELTELLQERKSNPIFTQWLSDFPSVFNGVLSGRGDYKLFCAADRPDRPPFLQHVSQSSVGAPVELFTVDGRSYSRTSMYYLRSLAFLKKFKDTSCIRNVLEIGGGFGSLGEIMLKANPPHYFYVNVDIPPLASISTYYLKSIFGENAVADYSVTKDLDLIDIEALRRRYRAVVLCPWQLPKVRGTFELFVNMHSFQEMEPHVVQNYCRIVSKLTSHFVMLKNSITGKKVAENAGDVGVLKPTLLADYIEYLKPKFTLSQSDHLTFGESCGSLISCLMLFCAQDV